MYEDWQIKRWDTPVSDVDSLIMVSLVDDGVLRITLKAPQVTERSCWCFSFETYPAYRNILEEYRLSLWRHLDDSGQRCGHTFTVENSFWIASLRSQEPLLGVHNPSLVHYVISTEDDVIEVLSPSVEYIYLRSAALRASSSDKSTVLYNSADRAEVETAFENIIEAQRYNQE